MKENTKKILCVIPARGGSKGLKDKNIKLLNGKPLIAWPILYAKKIKQISKVIVSTDDKKIAKLAIRFGAEVPFLRPKKISGDNATTESVLQYSILKIEEIENAKYDYCVFLTATDIFREKEWLLKCINTILDKKNQNIESVFMGYKTHKNFWELDKKGNWKRLKPWMSKYSSRQIRRTIVREDTGLSCISKAEIWRKGKRIGNRVKIIVHDNELSFIDIHSKNDLKIANNLLRNYD